MNKFFIALFVFCGLAGLAKAQHSDDTSLKELKKYQDTLQTLSFDIVNKEAEAERYNASFTFIKTLVRALKTYRSFNFPFDSLKSISIMRSPDSRFRLFTWHVMHNDGSYRYYGTVQMNTPDGKLQLFPLVDHTPAIKNPADTLTTNDKWYGARYYRIIPVPHGKTPYYILLGWKGNTVKSTKKVIEVLHFKDGKAYFGMPVFDGDPDRLNAKRIIFEYTRQASMLLNYDQSITSIVFDHLAPPAPGMKGRYDLYGPDMSYDAYRLGNNGRWKLVEDLPLKNPPSQLDEQYNDPRKMKSSGPTRKLE